MNNLSDDPSMEDIKSMFLSQDEHFKTSLLAHALLENNLFVFKEFSLIALDAPISEGGLPTEVIEDIYKYPELYKLNDKTVWE